MDLGELSHDCNAILEKLVVPICAPVSSIWDENLKDLLEFNYENTPGMLAKMLACQLLDYGKVDLIMKNGLNQEVLAVEFKLHKDPLSGSDLRGIFDKIYENSTCWISCGSEV